MARLPPGLPTLLLLQLGAEGAVMAVDTWLTGGVGFVAPALAGAVAAGVYGFRLRRRGACGRPLLRRLGLAVGLAHVPVGALAYAAAWSRAPELYPFGLGGLPLVALVIGALVGGLAFIAASCALDLGVHAAGGVTEAEPRMRSFREPPG
jgi:hypothetical protein